MTIALWFIPGLIDNHQCAGTENAVQNRIVTIGDQWEYLTKESATKSMKLKEANKQQTFNISVKDIEFWLGEVRTFVSEILHSSMCD